VPIRVTIVELDNLDEPDMTYAEGTTLTIMNKGFTLADIATMYVDESEVKDNTVSVTYNGSTAAVTVAGNVAQYLTIATNGAHVAIEQSADVVEEITYTLSGNATDGEFYEFSKSGVLNVVGNLKHAIKAGEYIEVKDATINVTSAVCDGINCAQYFFYRCFHYV
jgi:hypothetical protein